MKKFLSVIIIGLFFLCSPGHAREIIDLFPERPGALFCWKESLSKPRLLKAHFLMIDLTSKELEVTVMPGEDPDGDGPAESQLTPPNLLFNKFRAIAAVNANAFAGLSKEEISTPLWYEGQPVDICGLAVSRSETVSPAESQRTSFWLDKNSKPHIGDPSSGVSVTEAVADWFSPLILNSKIIPVSNTTGPEVHPRTALGFDSSGKWLLLAVVDGRQPGYSEGVTLHELALIMQERGCTQSINLDGGGSSIMLVREKDNKVTAFNKPSDGEYRPVPVMLGVRRKEK